MRKNELFKLYEESFNKIQALNIELEGLKAENLKLKSRISELESEIESKEDLCMEEISEKTEIAETEKEVKTPLDMDYGARTIGRIVVSATKHCNAISARGEGIQNKELVNLILGRTEVAKSEIMNIISSDCEIDVKKEMISREEAMAEDYFISVLGQL